MLSTKMKMLFQKCFYLNLSNIPTNYQVLTYKHLFDGIKKCCGRTLYIRILQKLESTPGLSRFYDQNRVNSPLYTAF